MVLFLFIFFILIIIVFGRRGSCEEIWGLDPMFLSRFSLTKLFSNFHLLMVLGGHFSEFFVLISLRLSSLV